MTDRPKVGTFWFDQPDAVHREWQNFARAHGWSPDVQPLKEAEFPLRPLGSSLRLRFVGDVTDADWDHLLALIEVLRQGFVDPASATDELGSSPSTTDSGPAGVPE